MQLLFRQIDQDTKNLTPEQAALPIPHHAELPKLVRNYRRAHPDHEEGVSQFYVLNLLNKTEPYHTATNIYDHYFGDIIPFLAHQLNMETGEWEKPGKISLVINWRGGKWTMWEATASKPYYGVPLFALCQALEPCARERKDGLVALYRRSNDDKWYSDLIASWE